MNRLILYLLFLFFTITAMAQVNVTGTVIDKESKEPLGGASVIVKGAEGKIKKFASSKSNGNFEMTMPSGRLPTGSVYDGFRQTVNPS